MLTQSAGLLAGTGSYAYLSASPDLLAALVGALSTQLLMSSRDFFAALRRDWGMVVNQESSAATSLSGQLDGAALQRNARRTEQLMAEAGLALADDVRDHRRCHGWWPSCASLQPQGIWPPATRVWCALRRRRSPRRGLRAADPLSWMEARRTSELSMVKVV